MCGICGIYNFKTGAMPNLSRIKEMAASIEHRGPDDDGYYLKGNLGLGFRRLSIIDLSEAGHQPMANGNRKIWVVFNGEIYNFKAIRIELEDKGYAFASDSDTEVIVHGYECWGEDVLNHLNGMFGLAIWDEQERKLILARDRTGIKLIYYSYTKQGIVFGSEIKAVVSGLGYTPDVDTEAMQLFLNYRYTPSPLTIHKNIMKLAPGEKLVLRHNSEPYSEVWWKYAPPPPNRNITLEEAERSLIRLYKNSINRHLISDVPVGLLLSGGIDSALLLYLMNRSGEKWPTFTIGYGNSYIDDELSHAAKSAKILGADHHGLLISRKEFEDTLPEVINCLEEPIASPSMVPMYLICKKAREKVTVALIGQGPDELFGGYIRHLGLRYGSYWRRIPEWVRSPLKAILSATASNESLNRSLYSLDQKQRKRRYANTLSLLPPGESQSLFRDGILPSNNIRTLEETWSIYNQMYKNTDELGGFQFFEIRSTLPDELLMYSDKLSMAHGLELRVPYLDQEIVEWVETLPENMKIRMFQRKYLHKKICEACLPREITQRKKKGFAVNVVNDWFSETSKGKLNTYIRDPQSLMYEFLDFEKVKSIYQHHITKRQNYHKILFSLVVFEEWMKYKKL